MSKNQSNELSRFRTLIAKDYKRVEGKKNREEIRDLLELFVDNCPSKEGPENAKKFKNYNIEYGAHYSKLKNIIIASIGLKDKDTYRWYENAPELEGQIADIEQLYAKRRKAVVFFTKDNYGEMDSLYIRIRNSFAHGNYFKIKDYYYLWNETRGKKYSRLGSFMVLKYEHLKKIYMALHDYELSRNIKK